MNPSVHATGTTGDPPALARGELLPKLGHELRGPLNGIIGLTRILLTTRTRGPVDPEVETRQLTMVQASAHQMLHTVEQVVSICRLQSDQPPPEPTSFDCRDTITDVVDAYRPAAADRGLQLIIDCPPESVTLTADARLLARLLHELIDNAVRFTDRGDVRVRVLARDANTAVVEVSDDGPPIPAGERALIFEAFERGEAAVRQDEPGAGLGLYLARELALQLGADLGLSDIADPGTAFILELPRGHAPTTRPRAHAWS